MSTKTYSIFGAGAAGLYTAWRLLDGTSKNKKNEKLLVKGDILELYDWGKYDFSKKNPGTREPGARVCTWHYKDNKDNSYLELGGMRYLYWDGTPKGPGHRLVTKAIEKLDLKKDSIPFNESADPLMSLRSKNMYISDVTSNQPAPYAANNYGEDAPPDDGFTAIQSVAITQDSGPVTRREWCKFYEDGKINIEMPESSIFKKGDLLKEIGYWNLGYDMLGQEGFSYLSDGNGYSSNVVNSNSAQSFNVNDEFTPGTEYKTLIKGYSSLFDSLFEEVEKLAKQKGITLNYYPNTRLRSILHTKSGIHFTTAKRESPDKLAESKKCDAAFLAMPRAAIELVAEATRYSDAEGLDVLNHEKVQLYLESVIMEPSYKIGMFFKTPWWRKTTDGGPTYPAKLTSYFLTLEGIAKLKKENFPAEYLNKINNPAIIGIPFNDKASFIAAVENAIQERLTFKQESQILTVAELDTIGPSITDMPIRQVVYFGDNARNEKGDKVYGILASYDDIQYSTFWKALELGPKATRKIPESRDCQPLEGPRKATPVMVKMLRSQLAALHFGPQTDYSAVPEPLETKYMDWSLPPFNAGYHAYKSHYNLGDVQRKIRKPSQLVPKTDCDIFIVGETYSNDQAWVEGAFCTAESVLNDFFGIEPIIDEKYYPFISPE
ncbi:FAD-dependent oxidoreductase [Flavobacterium sp. PS2]|uniref:FAD-dependent oxidoreductase n=1 Tax=Flavobacterium sp. PS2 TaxID=3384157 RepID=UPI00390C7ABC